LLAADPFHMMSLDMGHSMFDGEHFTSGSIAHDGAFPAIEGAVTGTSIDIEHLMGAGDLFPMGSGFGTLSPPTGISALGTDGVGFQFDSIGLGAQDIPAVIDMMDVSPVERMPSNGITLINRGTITVGSDFDLGSLPDNLTLINEGEIVFGDADQSATDSFDLGMLVDGSYGLPGGFLGHGDGAISVVEIGDNLPEGLDLESLSSEHGFFTIDAIELLEGTEVPEGAIGHSGVVVDSGVITLPAGDVTPGHDGVMSGVLQLPEGTNPADLSEEELTALLQAEIAGQSGIVMDSGMITLPAGDFMPGHGITSGVIELPEGTSPADLSEEELAAMLQGEIDGHSGVVVDSGIFTLPAGDVVPGHGFMSGVIELPEDMGMFELPPGFDLVPDIGFGTDGLDEIDLESLSTGHGFVTIEAIDFPEGGELPEGALDTTDLSEEELTALLQAEIEGHPGVTMVDSGVITLSAGDIVLEHGAMSGVIELPEDTTPDDLSEEDLTALLQGSTDTGLPTVIDVAQPLLFTNPANPLDTSADGIVDTADLRSVFDHLNQWGASPVPHEPQDAVVYVDVNADERVTPLDALVLINWLNGSDGVLHHASISDNGLAEDESDDPTEAAFAVWGEVEEFDLLFG